METTEYYALGWDSRCKLGLPHMKQALCARKTFVPIGEDTPPKPPEIRYAACSLSTKQLPLRAAARAMRSHWGIENTAHWRKDALMREDHHNLRTGNAPLNMTILRSATLALLDSLWLPFLTRQTTATKTAFPAGAPARAARLLINDAALATL